jgi:hypothetical protein
MQLHGREDVAQYELQPLCHVALPVERTLRVVPHVSALEEAPNDLTQRVDAGDRAILEPAHEEALDIRLPAPHHPLDEALRVGGRGHPAAMQRTAGSVAGDDLRLITVGGLAQVDAFSNFKCAVEPRPRHAEPSLAEPR